MDKDERVQVLRDLIQINSVNGNEAEVAAYLKQLFDKHGIEAQVEEFGDRRANLLVDLGSGDKVLGITGHMDTVALGDESKWTYPPLAAKVVGDKLYGRGAADMKSGLAAQVIALIELHDEGQLPEGHIRFIATAGEEYGTPGADRLEKAGVARDLSALVVGEPTSGDVVFAHSGSYNYRIKSVGKSVHSSEPERGLNALDTLVDYCLKERTLFDDAPEDPYLGKIKHSVTIFKAGDQVNTIPDYAEIWGNIRATRAFGNDEVTARIKKAIEEINAQGKAQLSFELLHDWRPVASDLKSDFVQDALAASKAAFADYPEHRTPELKTTNGATDASVFVKSNPDLPVILLGADDWSIAHQIDEYTTISSFLAVTDAYKQIIRDYFK